MNDHGIKINKIYFITILLLALPFCMALSGCAGLEMPDLTRERFLSEKTLKEYVAAAHYEQIANLELAESVILEVPDDELPDGKEYDLSDIILCRAVENYEYDSAGRLAKSTSYRYLDNNVPGLYKDGDKLKFTQFLTVMAARTGQMLNCASIADQLEIASTTVREWVSLLETSGIIYIMQPFTNSALNRAIKTPKVYFRDTGLACFLTKYQTPETAMNGALAGALFETFAVSEVLKSFSNAGRDYRMNVSYYREKDKIRRRENGETMSSEAEIDMIIEQDGVIYPVEIKMSANPKLAMTDAFPVLDKIPEKKRGTGIILCMYDRPLWLRENVLVLPVECI